MMDITSAAATPLANPATSLANRARNTVATTPNQAGTKTQTSFSDIKSGYLERFADDT